MDLKGAAELGDGWCVHCANWFQVAGEQVQVRSRSRSDTWWVQYYRRAWSWRVWRWTQTSTLSSRRRRSSSSVASTRAISASAARPRYVSRVKHRADIASVARALTHCLPPPVAAGRSAVPATKTTVSTSPETPWVFQRTCIVEHTCFSTGSQHRHYTALLPQSTQNIPLSSVVPRYYILTVLLSNFTGPCNSVSSLGHDKILQ